jgi:hypothetical protein
MKSALIKPKRLSANGDSSVLASQEAEERIRRRAHEIYEQQGREEGRHLEHWLQAEHELLGTQPDKRTN